MSPWAPRLISTTAVGLYTVVFNGATDHAMRDDSHANRWPMLGRSRPGGLLSLLGRPNLTREESTTPVITVRL